MFWFKAVLKISEISNKNIDEIIIFDLKNCVFTNLGFKFNLLRVLLTVFLSVLKIFLKHLFKISLKI